MKRLLLTGMFAALFIPGTLFVGCGGDDESTGEITSGGIQFVTDYNTAVSQAQANDQNLVIEFYTDWCKWCKKLESETFVDPAVVAMDENLVFAKINAEVDTVTAKKYSVTGYPTVIVAKSDGTEIDRIPGYLPAEEFKTEVNNYLQGIGTLDYYLSVADTVETPQVMMKIADKYSERGKYDEAEQYYVEVIEMDPKNDSGHTVDAKMQIANIYRWTDQYDKAIASYQKLIDDNKGKEVEADAAIRMAVAYRDKGDTAMAVKSFKGFVESYPDSPDTAYALSQVEKLTNPPAPEEAGT